MVRALKGSVSVFGPALLGMLVSFSAGCSRGRDTPPTSTASAQAPLPTPSEAVAPPPSASVIPMSVARPGQNFANCCAALLQSSVSAPEPTKTRLLAAGDACKRLVDEGESGASSIRSALRSILRSDSLPSSCL